jgi:hypothetical protein
MVMIHTIVFDDTRLLDVADMCHWCESEFGKGSWDADDKDDMDECGWARESMSGNTRFYFKNEQQYHWFLLRWR